ncbi:MAG: CvpA family protein [Endozoicomonadaceae bacterium]|nr:CvpA family protein [Endozoicomonadaceae bacterium]
MEATFNWIDWLIIGLIVVSAMISLWRGFVREIFSVMIWLATTLAAWLFLEDFAALFSGWIDSYSVRITFAAIILIVMVLLISTVINMVVGKLISVSGLSGSDRLLGMFFGCFRGIVIATIFAGVVAYLPNTNAQWKNNSVLMPKFEQLAIWSQTLVKNKISPLIYDKKTSGTT